MEQAEYQLQKTIEELKAKITTMNSQITKLKKERVWTGLLGFFVGTMLSCILTLGLAFAAGNSTIATSTNTQAPPTFTNTAEPTASKVPTNIPTETRTPIPVKVEEECGVSLTYQNEVMGYIVANGDGAYILCDTLDGQSVDGMTWDRVDSYPTSPVACVRTEYGLSSAFITDVPAYGNAFCEGFMSNVNSST